MCLCEYVSVFYEYAVYSTEKLWYVWVFLIFIAERGGWILSTEKNCVWVRKKKITQWKPCEDLERRPKQRKQKQKEGGKVKLLYHNCVCVCVYLFVKIQR